MLEVGILFLILLTGPASASEQDPWSFLGEHPPSALDPARLTELGRSVAWRKLLHYRVPFLRKERGDIDDPAFYLAESGKTDPVAELRETLRTFFDPALAVRRHGSLSQPRACAFPARREFLAAELGEEFLRRVAPVGCGDFIEWERGIAARGASLVFASAYPNNPASMFGHTFLRLDRGGASASASAPVHEASKQMDLLSYGVNFSAAIGPNENPVKYAIWGLIGGYIGRYDLSPYYQKVNEYAFSESRDLWEYRLALTEAEVRQLVRHIWELYGQGGLDYYFLDENCSYQILTAIEAVRPAWDLSTGFFLSAIPVDTVQHVMRVPGAVVSVGYRPSLRNQMVAALEQLDASERQKVRHIFADYSEADRYEAEIATLTTAGIDALISSLAYERERKGREAARGMILRAALVARSQRDVAAAPRPETPPGLDPSESHGSSRFGLGIGVSSGRPRYDLNFAGFRHDFLDRTASFNPFSEVRIFDVQARFLRGDRLRFERVDLLAMASLAPDSIYDGQRSWKIDLGWRRIREQNDHAGKWEAGGGYGIAANFLGSRNLVYALARGELTASGVFRHSIRFSAGGDLGFVLNPVIEKYFLHLRIVPIWDVNEAVLDRRFRPRAEIAQSLVLGTNLDLRAILETEAFQMPNRSWRRAIRGELAIRF